MMKALILAFALAVAGCASIVSVSPTPEAQIKTGADSVKAAETGATIALRDHKISVAQAKSYRNMLVTAGEALHDANTELERCRKDTSSTSATSPDPCWLTIRDVVNIALENIGSIRKAIAK